MSSEFISGEPPVSPVRPLAALRALAALRRNPQDTQQVFLLTEALRGRSGLRLIERVRADAAGQRLLRERPALLDSLTDRAYLRSLPEGSLGRAYLAFMASEDLSAEGLVEVSRDTGLYVAGDTSDRGYFSKRLRDMHDLFHVLTGYGRDELGEICVLAFSYPHQRTRSFALIAFFGMLSLRHRLGVRGVSAAVRQAWRQGRRAAWLPVQPLEQLLAEDLQALRERLGIAVPTRYLAVQQAMQARAAVQG